MESQVSFKVFNPNNIKSSVIAATINTFYKGLIVGSSKLGSEVALPPKDTTDIHITSKLNPCMLAKVFPEFLATDLVEFAIEGSSKVKSFGIAFTIPIKHKIKLNVKQILVEQVDKVLSGNTDFKIKGLKLDKLPSLEITNFRRRWKLATGYHLNIISPTLI